MSETSRQAGILAAKVLKGQSPPTCPSSSRRNFDLMINLKTTNAWPRHSAHAARPSRRGDRMRRRKFMALLGGAAAWPLAARAQQPAMPVIGYLGAGSPAVYAELLAAFRRGLEETGYVPGRNVAIEFRWAEGRFERLPELAADLVQRRVALIVTTGSSSSLAAKAASSTIPLVFQSQGDPVKEGLVASFNRPGGNATGMSLFTGVLAPKRLELVRQLASTDAPIAYLMNPQAPEAELYLSEVQTAARSVGQQIVVLYASRERDVDGAFGTLAEQRARSLVVSTDGWLFSRRDQIIAAAARLKVPTIYDRREFVTAGGLVSYGTQAADAQRRLGVYAGRILAGEKPADLPVVQPIRFELIVNLKTAKALGLEVPPTLLVAADEVIE
ncbi:MAG: ABC transporter substrate binding protein [Xanthobacteraceae bacterium]